MLNALYTLVIYPLTQIIEFAFVFTNKIFKQEGLAVVGVSIVISLCCLPLYLVAEKWQETERGIQKRLKPTIDRIKAVFRGDERYMILSTYYRQNHYSPVYALRSSFGVLIQIPFFIAAYGFLSHLEALRGHAILFYQQPRRARHAAHHRRRGHSRLAHRDDAHQRRIRRGLHAGLSAQRKTAVVSDGRRFPGPPL